MCYYFHCFFSVQHSVLGWGERENNKQPCSTLPKGLQVYCIHGREQIATKDGCSFICASDILPMRSGPLTESQCPEDPEGQKQCPECYHAGRILRRLGIAGKIHPAQVSVISTLRPLPGAPLRDCFTWTNVGEHSLLIASTRYLISDCLMMLTQKSRNIDQGIKESIILTYNVNDVFELIVKKEQHDSC